MGRLGNQLFQVASTIGVAKKNNHDYCFPNWAVNQYLKNPIPTNFMHADMQIKEAGCDYQDLNLECEGNLSIDLVGYFQSERYFKNYETVIRDHLILNDELNKGIEDKYRDVFEGNVASVHVRCGDYRSLNKVYHSLPKSYFDKCIEESGAQKILFFSDDISHCKDVFMSEGDFLFISERQHDQNLIADTRSAEIDSPKYLKEDLLELFLMSKCRTNIISNSTYGWWAAWLNNHPDKQVFAPNEWFTQQHLDVICAKEKQENYLNDIVPESWKKR